MLRVTHLRHILILAIVSLCCISAIGVALAQSQPTTTPQRYIVRGGDTLSTIAVRFGLTTRELADYNDIANINFVFNGQILRIPPPSARDVTAIPPANVTAQPTPSSSLAAPTPTIGAEAATETLPTPSAALPEAGLVVFVDADSDIGSITRQAQQLGVDWLKLTVDWRDIEPIQGQREFTLIDNALQSFRIAGFDVLLTLTGAPNWARPSATTYVRNHPREYGPPDDLSLFGDFAGAVAARYGGEVAAYEIWMQPNLRRNWLDALSTSDDARRMSDTMYIDLLRIAYDAIKDADPAAQVITGGLAPTGFNDRVNAIDDREFLRALLQQGVLQVSDGIGAHPAGFGNPPDLRAPQQDIGVQSQYQSTRFFFLDTLSDYREILQVADAADVPIWVTRFGWGSDQGTVLSEPLLPFQAYLTYVTQAEQAQFALRALEIGQALPNIGPMLLYNLNACSVGHTEDCFYSMIDAAGQQRPLFDALQSRLNTPTE